jgi:hypothetical protein
LVFALGVVIAGVPGTPAFRAESPKAADIKDPRSKLRGIENCWSGFTPL